MNSNIDVVDGFYAALAAGDALAALEAMASDIEWIGMVGWPYKTEGRGPAAVADHILGPMLSDWQDLLVTPNAFYDAGETIISTGRYAGMHRVTGKALDAAFAHVWTVRDGRLARFRQFADTLVVDWAMR